MCGEHQEAADPLAHLVERGLDPEAADMSNSGQIVCASSLSAISVDSSVMHDGQQYSIRNADGSGHSRFTRETVSKKTGFDRERNSRRLASSGHNGVSHVTQTMTLLSEPTADLTSM